jgi:hypothetical protein
MGIFEYGEELVLWDFPPTDPRFSPFVLFQSFFPALGLFSFIPAFHSLKSFPGPPLAASAFLLRRGAFACLGRVF